ncbi:NAD(P)/FAD-dependent oxidoreductase [Alkalibacillus haloalkaliphilus]|uniref:Ferredoxin--NADP reductase n=1 Tax=Alkalibacillus haloalkaliphilus TaxID=94136 RepID=A0A511W347_9BACI|nr:NAD(P)/FAD-dependent oxidoreductase [Alkalibacillus haloalkaliphilus]GEN44513.1 ferredoxin--NADP reductase 2 [Alkalibacillus haloalkaliphilus]
MFNDRIYDITVIGAGPVGLFTAFYAGMREASVNVIDSMPQVGGQLAALYPDKYIYDVAGFPKVKAQELVDHLHEQAKTFSPSIHLEQSVTDISRHDEYFEIFTTQGTHYSKTIIITAGAGAFQPRKLKAEQAEQYEGSNLHYFVQKLDQFKNRRILLCGGGDSAIDWSLALEPIAEQVTLVHRRDKFRAHEHSVTQLKNSNVNIMTPFEVDRLIGDGNRIEQVAIKEVKGEQLELIDVDDVIVNYGFVTSLGPLKSWGLELQKNSIFVNSKMETNIPGIFAAGDICTYEGKPKLIATGFGEAPIAVNHAKSMIDPKAKLSIHSTHLFEKSK